jgi:hypothetical protein
MAKVWVTAMQNKGMAWGIPANTVTELQTAATEAEDILNQSMSADRTATITTECQRLFSMFG